MKSVMRIWAKEESVAECYAFPRQKGKRNEVVHVGQDRGSTGNIK